ncbi:MAG: type 4a pilus biogenesis protein PilO [Acidobacteria bacterium]|nr:type 4a pilus biogenesis protein PilO [Acidobacteriota bacterium]
MTKVGAGGRVSIARVAAEHRAWLLPLGLALAANIAVLLAVVVPLARAAASTETRAQAARQALQAAERELKAAEATRDGQALATEELTTFYGEVLPADIRMAARITHVNLAQLAEEHDVRYEQMASSAAIERDSPLERLQVTTQLSGRYEDIRAFLHQLETASDFVVIDNMVLGEGTEDERLTLDLELSTYYRAGKHGA